MDNDLLLNHNDRKLVKYRDWVELNRDYIDRILDINIKVYNYVGRHQQSKHVQKSKIQSFLYYTLNII